MPNRETDWFAAFAAEHDKLARCIRECFPAEADAGKATNPESVFDTAVRLLRAAAPARTTEGTDAR